MSNQRRYERSGGHKGLETHDVDFDGARLLWDRFGTPAAYPHGDPGDELEGECHECGELGELFGEDELGLSFGKLIKGIGKIAKKAVKVAAPILKVAGTVTAFIVPPAGAVMVGAAVAADKLISAAERGNKTAKLAYSATKTLAGKGDKDASRALTMLSAVQQRRRKTGAKPGAPMPVTPKAAAALAKVKGRLQRPLKGPAAKEAIRACWVIDAAGNTYAGRTTPP
jgi:hypothetical protein